MLTTLFTTFLLIFVAEFGDKSQFVCMLLATRHRRLPVILGASAAFILLNLVAVSFGAAASTLVPEFWLRVAVTVLFTLFGLQALLQQDEGEADIEEKPRGSVFATAFLMIFVAELGDKTQLAVSALGASSDPVAVYLGATLALIATSILGVLLGGWLATRVRVASLHRVSGLMFLGFALWVGIKLWLH